MNQKNSAYEDYFQSRLSRHCASTRNESYGSNRVVDHFSHSAIGAIGCYFSALAFVKRAESAAYALTKSKGPAEVFLNI